MEIFDDFQVFNLNTVAKLLRRATNLNEFQLKVFDLLIGSRLLNNKTDQAQI